MSSGNRSIDPMQQFSPGSGEEPLREQLQDFYRLWSELRDVGLPFDGKMLRRQMQHLQQLELINSAEQSRLLSQIERPASIPPEDWSTFQRDLLRALKELKDSRESRLRQGPHGPSPVSRVATPLPAKPADTSGNGAATKNATVPCRECETPNPLSRNYCAQCGAGLWCICPSCRHRVPSNETFCGYCGFGIGEQLLKDLENVRFRLSKIESQLEASEPYEAFAALEELLENLPTWFSHAAIRQKIDQLRERTESVINESRAQNEQAVREAAQLANAGDFLAAIRRLETIPEGLRDQTVRELLERYRQVTTDLGTLEAELQTNLARQNVLGILAVVQKILSLKPDHPPALEAARKLTGAIRQAVQARLAKQQYREAHSVLTRLPRNLWDEQLLALERKLGEILGIQRLLQRATYSYPYLPKLVERLEQLVPAESPLAVSARNLLECFRLEQLPPRAWIKRVRRLARSVFGPPIVLADRFFRIEIAPSCDRKVLLESPGIFLAATGAALHGLQAAPVNMGLIPEQLAGLAQRMLRLIRARPRSAWGLDIGISSVKAVRLEMDPVREVIQATQVSCWDYSKPLHHAANVAQAFETMADAIQAFLASEPTEADQVILALPPQFATLHCVSLRQANVSKLDLIVRMELKRLLPEPIENLVFAHAIWPSAKEGANDREMTLLLAASRRLYLSDLTQRLRGFGLQVDGFVPDMLALLNWFLFDCWAGPDQEAAAPDESPDTGIQNADLLKNAPGLIVDMGANHSNTVYIGESRIRSRSIGSGTSILCRTFAQRFNLTYSQAEKAIRNWSFGPTGNEKIQCFQEFASQAARDIESVFQQLHSQGLPPPKWILACGGGFVVPELLDAWAAPDFGRSQ